MKKKSLLLVPMLLLGSFSAPALTSCKQDKIVNEIKEVKWTIGDQNLVLGDTLDINNKYEVVISGEMSKEVTITSSNTEVASIVNGVITGLKKGTADITVTSVADNTKSAKFKLTVSDINWDIKNQTISLGETLDLNGKFEVTVGDETSTEVTVVSANTEVATVANGVITPIKTGTSQITVTSVANTLKTATFTLTVDDKRALTIEGASSNLVNGNTLQLSAKLEKCTGTVVWSSSNTSVATVDATGKVTAGSVLYSTEVTITASLTLADKVLSKSVTITIVNSNPVYVAQLQKNANFVKFDNNRKLQDNKNIEFKDLTQPHFVGDDSNLQFKPITTFIDADENEVTYTGSWDYKLKLQVYNGSSFEDTTTNAYADSVDLTNCTINFNEAAIGKTFKLIVEPDNLTANQMADEDYDEYYKVSYEVAVVDGYNVYSAQDLAYFDNRVSVSHDSDDSAAGAAWSAYRAAHDMDATASYDNIVLQKDITVTTSDFPASFLWDETDNNFPVNEAAKAERLKGSLEDYTCIYKRYVTEHGSSSIKGNYYTLNAQSIPLVCWDDDGYRAENQTVVAHSQLFFVDAQNAVAVENNTSNPEFRLSEINLIGNAPRADQLKYGGGLIFMKNENLKTTMYNNLSTSWFITYFPNFNKYDSFLIDSCKAFDNYSNFIYDWGSPLDIVNSDMTNCGGPIIIADDVTRNQTTHNPSTIKFDLYSSQHLVSYVNGTEGWFQSYTGATAAASAIIGMDGLLNAAGRSILKTAANDETSGTKYFNFIVLYKDGSAQGLTSTPVQGNVQIADNPAWDFTAGGPSFLDYYVNNGASSAYLGSTASGYPLFQSINGATALYTGSGTTLSQCDPSAGGAAVSTSDNIFKGSNIGLYYQGMFILFGYYNFTGAYETF